MSAREVIARASTPTPDECWHGSGSSGPSGADYTCQIYMWQRELPRADAILAALTAAGYRIVGPGEVEEDAASIVYGRLLHKHLKAARDDLHGSRRKKLFDLIEAFRAEFPADLPDARLQAESIMREAGDGK